MPKSPAQRRRFPRKKERNPDVAPHEVATADPPSASAGELKKQERPLQNIVDAASIVQSVLTAVGIVAAAIWFFVQSESSPKANITHTITGLDHGVGHLVSMTAPDNPCLDLTKG